MIKSSEKYYFFDESKFLQLNKGFFLWTADYDFAVILLNSLPYYRSTTDLIDSIYFSNTDVFMESIESAKCFIFLESLKKHSYSNLTTSIIFYYLQSRYNKNKTLSLPDWVEILDGLLDPKTTNSVFFFLEEFNMINFLLETKTELNFIAGLLFYYETREWLAFKSSDLKAIKNLYKFLKIEESIRKSLIKKTLSNRNFTDLIFFFLKSQLYI